MNMKYVYKTAVLVSLTLIIIVFTNCGKPSTLLFENGNIANSPGSASSSSSLSVRAFEETVYPITRANCLACHDKIQPTHAIEDVSVAHDSLINQVKINFVTPSSSRIVKKLLDEQHNCWGDCADNAAEMEAAITRWAQLSETGRSPAGGNSIVTGVMTAQTDSIAAELAKAGNANVNYVLNGITSTGKTLSFNINALLGNPGGNFLFLVDVYDYDTFSYQFRNPRIIVPGTPIKRIYIRNIKIAINGEVKPEHPVWIPIDTSTRAATNILSASAMLASKNKGNATDKISFNIQEIRVDNRTAAEFSRDSYEKTVYKVTRENCSSCHAVNRTPLHASANLQIAHDASLPLVNFANIQQSRFITKIRAGHQAIDPVEVPAAFAIAIDEWNKGRQ